jgi:hypothetical protein
LAFFAAIACLSFLFKRWYELGFGPWWLMVLSLLAGVLTADIASGFIHWWMDTWGTPETPIVGELFIRDFRIHHTDEKEMTRHNFFETNGNNALVLLIVLIPAIFFPPSRPEVLAFLISFSLGILFTNQIHKWAHVDTPPRVISRLQSYWFILPPDVHRRHHVYPHTTYYNITTGWLNSLAERARLYPALERIIIGVTGWKPRP